MGMEGSAFIGRERELGIYKGGRKVDISRGEPMMIRSRGPNERARPYQQQPISSSLFPNILMREAPPPIWENLPEEAQCGFSYENICWKCECITKQPAINTGR